MGPYHHIVLVLLYMYLVISTDTQRLLRLTTVALLEAVLTVVWKAEVVRGSLFWLVHPSRNFSTHTTDRKD